MEDYEKIKISELDSIELEDVTEANVIVDTGKPDSYDKFDLKKLSNKVELIFSKESLNASNNVTVFKVRKNGTDVLISGYSMTITDVSSGLTINQNSIDTISRNLTVINTNVTDQLLSFTVNIVIDEITYFKTISYINSIAGDTYSLRFNTYNINVNNNEIFYVEVLKNNITPIPISISDFDISSSKYNVSVQTFTTTKLKVVFSSSKLASNQESIPIIYIPKPNITENIIVSSKSVSSTILSFSSAISESKSQILYFYQDGEYKDINLDKLITNITYGTITNITNITYSDRPAVKIDFTVTQPAVISAYYTPESETYPAEVKVSNLSDEKVEFIIDDDSIKFTGEILEVYGRFYINGAQQNISNYVTVVDLNEAVGNNFVTNDGGDSKLVLQITDLSSSTTTIKAKVTYNNIAYGDSCIVYKELNSNYELRGVNLNPIYYGDPIISKFTTLKDNAAYNYVDANITVVSNNDDLLTISHNTPTSGKFEIKAENLTEAISYKVIWTIDGNQVDYEEVFINYGINEEYILECIDSPGILQDGQAVTFNFKVYKASSPNTLLNIANDQLIISNSPLNSTQQASEFDNMQAITFTNADYQNLNGTQYKVDVSFIDPTGKTLSELILITIKNSVVKPTLFAKPLLLNVNTDVDGTVLSESASTIVYCTANNEIVSITPSFLGVDCPELDSSKLIYNKTSNGDGGVLVTFTKVSKSANVEFQFTHNSEILSTLLPITANVTGQDVYTLIARQYSSKIANTLKQNLENIATSVSIPLLLTKNVIPVTGQTLTLTYDSSLVTANVTEVGNGLYNLNISALKTSNTKVTVAYGTTSAVAIIDITEGNNATTSGLYKSSASDSLLIETADKAFDVGTGYAYSVGLSVIAAYDIDNYMTGKVKSYTNGILTVSVDTIAGTGTYDSWNINIEGAPGVDGAVGADGAPGDSVELDLTTYPTRPGFRVGSIGDFTYTSDLKGADGEGLDFQWTGSILGIKKEGDSAYETEDLVGPTGANIELQKDVSGNLQWRVAGSGDAWSTLYSLDQLKGVGLEFVINGDQVGIRKIGDPSYVYSDPLTGPDGANGAIYKTTSTSSVIVETGDKTFTVASGLAYSVGQPIIAISTTNKLMGVVKTYSGTTLVMTVTSVIGSGTQSSWNINISGFTGLDGSNGANGVNGADGTDGTSTIIKGTTNIATILATSGEKGHIWIVADGDGSNDVGDGMISDGLGTGTSHWSNIGPLRGIQGEKGDKGNKGDTGEDGEAGLSTKLLATSRTAVNLTNSYYSQTDGNTNIIELEEAADFVIGQNIQVIKDANNYLFGRITNISGTTLTVVTRGIVGGGTHSNWSIVPSGEPVYSEVGETSDVVNYRVTKTEVSGSIGLTSSEMINSIIIRKDSGTPTVKIGSAANADDIMSSQVINDMQPPLISNVQYIHDLDDDWAVHYTVTGGSVTIIINCLIIR
jgi:hypothetical protein